MKCFLFSLIALLPLSGFAKIVPFQCTSADVQGIHKFDARGVVNIDDNNNVQGLVTLITQKAQADQSIQAFDEVKVDGHLRMLSLAPDEISPKEEYIQLVLKADTPYIKSLEILLNVKGQNASTAMSIDNFTYRSNCKIIENL